MVGTTAFEVITLFKQSYITKKFLNFFVKFKSVIEITLSSETLANLMFHLKNYKFPSCLTFGFTGIESFLFRILH
jgi:hypothetical protein